MGGICAVFYKLWGLLMFGVHRTLKIRWYLVFFPEACEDIAANGFLYFMSEYFKWTSGSWRSQHCQAFCSFMTIHVDKRDRHWKHEIILRWDLQQSRRCVLLHIDVPSLLLLLLILCLPFIPLVKWQESSYRIMKQCVWSWTVPTRERNLSHL